MNIAERTSHLFTDFLFLDNHVCETSISVDNGEFVEICFAKEPLKLDGKAVALGVVMTEKPHTLFFDCDQMLTSEFYVNEGKVVLSQGPWDATEGCYIKGDVTLSFCLKSSFVDGLNYEIKQVKLSD